jgi:hypothetical protein
VDVEQAVDAAPSRQPTCVRYETFWIWIGLILVVALIGIGALLLLAAPVPGACFVALGAVFLVPFRRAKDIGERALVLDDQGLSHTTFLLGAQYRVPWTQVISARTLSVGVALTLRAPRGGFRLPPRDPGRRFDTAVLVLPEWLDISGRKRVELIQAHLPDAGEGEPE